MWAMFLALGLCGCGCCVCVVPPWAAVRHEKAAWQPGAFRGVPRRSWRWLTGEDEGVHAEEDVEMAVFVGEQRSAASRPRARFGRRGPGTAGRGPRPPRCPASSRQMRASALEEDLSSIFDDALAAHEAAESAKAALYAVLPTDRGRRAGLKSPRVPRAVLAEALGRAAKTLRTKTNGRRLIMMYFRGEDQAGKEAPREGRVGRAGRRARAGGAAAGKGGVGDEAAQVCGAGPADLRGNVRGRGEGGRAGRAGPDGGAAGRRGRAGGGAGEPVMIVSRGGDPSELARVLPAAQVRGVLHRRAELVAVLARFFSSEIGFELIGVLATRRRTTSGTSWWRWILTS